jgi:hypothetical protein
MIYVKKILSPDWNNYKYSIPYSEHQVEQPYARFYEKTIEGDYLEIPINISINENKDIVLHNNLTSEGKVEIK